MILCANVKSGDTLQDQNYSVISIQDCLITIVINLISKLYTTDSVLAGTIRFLCNIEVYAILALPSLPLHSTSNALIYVL